MLAPAGEHRWGADYVRQQVIRREHFRRGNAPRRGEAAEKLRRRIARDREHLFVFITDRNVPATNNACERALRPSVIFRKVTNGFRSEWGAQTYAAFRSVVSTAKANGRSVLGDLRSVLATASDRETAAPVG